MDKKIISYCIVVCSFLLIFMLPACEGEDDDEFVSDPWVGAKQWGTIEDDYGWGIASDNSDNIYVTGYTFGSIGKNTNAGSYDIGFTKYNKSGEHIWSRQIGTASGDGASGIASDSKGNIYIVGNTEGDLDGGSNAGSIDGFLIKYDSTGNRFWTRLIGTATADYVSNVTVDNSGNVYVTGWTLGTLDGQLNAGEYDLILLKFDNSGNKLWDIQYGSTASEESRGIATDADGNIYITGSTTGSLDSIENSGGYDVFLAKYDSDGNRIWIQQLGTPYGDVGYDVTTDSLEGIYVIGTTNGNFDGHNNVGGEDLFLIKYNVFGQKLWSRLQGTMQYEGGTGVATDREGNVYLSGYSNSDFTSSGSYGDYDSILIKFDKSGNQLWARQYGTSFSDYAHDVTIDSSNSVFITGYTLGNLGAINHGSADIFILKYSTDGIRQ